MAGGARMGSAEWAMLLALSLLWGASFFFAKVALAALPPLTLVLGRTGIAAAALFLGMRIAGYRFPAEAGKWRRYLVMGLLNNVLPFTLLTWSQTEIASGLASILNALTPLSTALLGHLLAREERLTPAKLSGILVGIAGAAVVVGPAFLLGLGRHLPAELAALAATLCYASAGLYGRRFKGEAPMVTATGQLVASASVLLPLSLFLDRPWQLALPGASAWGALVGLALFSTALAYILYFRILARAGATNVLLVTFLMPPTTLLLGALFLGERARASELAGMGLIFAGLALVDGRILRCLRGRRATRPSGEAPPSQWAGGRT